MQISAGFSSGLGGVDGTNTYSIGLSDCPR